MVFVSCQVIFFTSWLCWGNFGRFKNSIIELKIRFSGPWEQKVSAGDLSARLVKWSSKYVVFLPGFSFFFCLLEGESRLISSYSPHFCNSCCKPHYVRVSQEPFSFQFSWNSHSSDTLAITNVDTEILRRARG